MSRRRSFVLLPILCAGALCSIVVAQPPAPDAPAAAERVLGEVDLQGLAWRSVGPANMGGRVGAIAVVPGSRTSFYVGYGTGGLWKTENLGVTFKPVFDATGVHSIGAVEVVDAPADWRGWAAEEEKARQAEAEAAASAAAASSSPPGTKSNPTTAKSKSTKKPAKSSAKPAKSSKDSRAERGKGKIVWVGTGEGNGRNSSSWGRGVFRSTDAGATFQSCGLEQTHNIPRLAVDRHDPDVCYVAALGHLWGPNPERGLYKTTDGGAHWERVLTVDDRTGACDVVLDPENSRVVYAAMYSRLRTPWSFEGNAETGGIFRSNDAGRTWKKLTEGLPPRTGRIGLAIFPGDSHIVYATVESDWGGSGLDPFDDRSPSGGLFRSDDRGDTWTRVSDFNFRPFYFSRLALDPRDAQRVYLPGWDLGISDDGGKTFRRSGSENVHVDFHAIVVNPEDPNQVLTGNDGGMYVSHDRCETWNRLANMAVGQFYRVAVDDSDPYRIGGGLQDNGSWIGPSATSMQTMDEGKDGILSEDWKMVYFGDGFGVAFDPTDPNRIYATAQGGYLGRVRIDDNVRKLLKATPREGQERFRFNWNAPFLLSQHDPTVLYHGGNRVFKLTERGDRWFAISPDLTRNEPGKTATVGSDAETYGTITTLAESPLAKGRLWAGSDDGRVHVTINDGKSWADVTPAQVGSKYVSRIATSSHELQTAYVAVDGHRSDVYDPLLLVTRDDGKTWQEIQGDLPAGAPVKCVLEDLGSTDVLYCGTETGCYVTFDRGYHWLRMNGKSLPPAPVDDIVQHPRQRDLVVGTHGRSIWVLDGAGSLGQLSATTRNRKLALLDPQPARPRFMGGRAYGDGHSQFRAKNPAPGARIDFWVRDDAGLPVTLSIADSSGFEVRSLSSTARPGLNRVTWDLQADRKHLFDDVNEREMGMTQFVAPGTYKVTVKLGDEKVEKKLRVLAAPDVRR